MKTTYPDMTLVFQHDNLHAHKNSDIMKVIQDDRLQMVYSPSHTPEFSAVENVFADLKRQLGMHQFESAEGTADAMARILFAYKPHEIKAFYKQVLHNIVDFWKKTDVQKVLDMYA